MNMQPVFDMQCRTCIDSRLTIIAGDHQPCTSRAHPSKRTYIDKGKMQAGFSGSSIDISTNRDLEAVNLVRYPMQCLQCSLDSTQEPFPFEDVIKCLDVPHCTGMQ